MVSRFIKWAERRFGFCWHDWYYDMPHRSKRTCDKCWQFERLEDDCGGWTAGQWNVMRKGRQGDRP